VNEADLIDSTCKETTSKIEGGHVLAIQDTTEFNFSWNKGRKKPHSGLGRCRHKDSLGFMLHPTLAVDADSSEVYGFSHIRIWHREEGSGTKHTRNYAGLPVEEKESNKWIESSLGSIARLQQADMVTIVEDREGDVYKQFCDIPGDNVHLLVRSSQNRRLDNGLLLHSHLKQLPVMGQYEMEVMQAGNSGAGKRTVQMDVRFDKVILQKPVQLKDQAKEKATLYIIHVSEVSPPKDASPIDWKLLTTHGIGSVTDALRVVGWYSKRWHIEQVFRLLKRKSFQIERSELENGWAIRKLTIMAMKSALTILQLRLAQQHNNNLPIAQVFSSQHRECLKLLNSKYEGSTSKLQNPYCSETLAWGSWIIARIGGWKGYSSQREPGLITLKEGLDKFEDIYKGFLLFAKSEDVCTP
jgi:hypothetical protein